MSDQAHIFKVGELAEHKLTKEQVIVTGFPLTPAIANIRLMDYREIPVNVAELNEIGQE